MDFDPRITPIKNGVAAEHLRGTVDASQFVKGQDYQFSAFCAGVFQSNKVGAKLDTQAQFGDVFTVYGKEGDWCWGQLKSDGYVGWVKLADLSEFVIAPNYKVSVLRTIVFTEPDLKTAPLGMLSLNAEVSTAGEEGDFVQITNDGWVYASHLEPLDYSDPDYVDVATDFLNAPYLWGGKDSLGLDCSGLVQSSMRATGKHVPRDADMQEKEVGDALGISAGLPELQKGDLVFWPGHVAIMIDDANIIHANAYHMMVAIEPLREAIERIQENTKTAVRSIKRPS